MAADFFSSIVRWYVGLCVSNKVDPYHNENILRQKRATGYSVDELKVIEKAVGTFRYHGITHEVEPKMATVKTTISAVKAAQKYKLKGLSLDIKKIA